MKTWCRAGLPGQSLQNVYTGLARLHIPPRDMVDWINRLPDAGRRLRPLSYIPARAQEALMVAFGAGGILQQTVLDRSTRRHSQATDGPTVRAICLTDLGDAPAWPWPAGCGHVLREDCFVKLLVASGSEAAYRPSCQRDQQGRFRPCPCVPGYWEICFHERSRGTTCDHHRCAAVEGRSLCTAGMRVEHRTGPTQGPEAAGGGPARPISNPDGGPEAEGGGGHGSDPKPTAASRAADPGQAGHRTAAAMDP